MKHPLPRPPRVLIADDNPSFSAATSRLLSPSCHVVGYAGDTASLLESTRELQPDVVLLDFSLGGDLNSLEACRRIKQTMPEVNVVAFTADDDAELKCAAYQAGVSGYVCKLRATDELVRTIQTVADGIAGSADDDAT